MTKKVLLATNNRGKIERFKHLVVDAELGVELLTPAELGLVEANPEETGKTLAENAEIKARVYFGQTDLPILANDTGFYVEGEGLVDAPKRQALGVKDESLMTKEEIAKQVLEFWKGVATKYGGKVDAAWVEAFVILDPDGTVRQAESRREIVLTDQEFGEPHIQLPVRALYYSKTTGKPAILHSKEEELLEMQPIIQALKTLLV